MLRLRFASASVLIPIVLGSVYVGGLCFFAVLAAALLLSGYEFFEMVRQAKNPPMTVLGLVLIAALVLDAYLQTNRVGEIIAAAIAVSLVSGIFRHHEGWLSGWGLTLAGALYIGWFGGFALRVRALDTGLLWTMLVLLTVWATDSGAYFAGTRLGKHAFFPKVSPKKTWEGAIGGWVAGVLVVLVLGIWLDIPLVHRILLGIGVALAATFGDLAESLLKRQTGVKDSSNLVPGHGGMLDRIDSVIFAAPFAYYYLVWVLRV